MCGVTSWGAGRSRAATGRHARIGCGGHPGGNPGANLKSISHRCHPILVAFVWELTKETIHLPLGCLQGGSSLKYGVQEERGCFLQGREETAKGLHEQGGEAWICPKGGAQLAAHVLREVDMV